MDSFLEMKNIEKTFPNGVHALKGASLTVKKGEIHALVGENAAGKSTLMNILYGSLAPDKGEILINGEKKNIAHPRDAIAMGIGMVHQHFKLVQDFTILENIILGYEEKYTNALQKIDYDRARADINDILKRIHVNLNLDQRTDTISIGLQSKVEIVKALFRGATLLILDEPTTVLAPNEVEVFFDFLRVLRDQGCTMIYISHRMKEIFSLSDSITVLRRGQDITSIETKNASMQQLANLMLGYDVKPFEYADRIKTPSGAPVLTLNGLCVENDYVQLRDISFSVRKGEVLGIAGIEGNGQVELADSIIGLLSVQSGSIVLSGKEISRMSTSERRKCSLAYVPDDRIRKGLALNASITENAILGHENNEYVSKKRRFIKWKDAKVFTEKLSKKYRVDGQDNVDQKISMLSGGNMQKVIVGREMIKEPEAIILAQPTAGVDFNAQRWIHEKIIELKEKGCAFLLISEDLDELLNLSDRILVLYRGRIVKEFKSCNDFDMTEIGYYMTGVKTDEAVV